MKKWVIFIFSIWLFLNINAQSDYEKVQNFKSEVDSISTSIDSVLTLDELDSLHLAINLLAEKYSTEKDLLDKSLYPDDYNKTIENLREQLKSRRENFASVGLLKAQIISLQNQLETLNEENTRLLEQIKEYQSVGGSDRASVTELRRLVSDLREKLKQRDVLVRSLVDSLLSDYVNHPMRLNEVEKQELYDKVETGNLFFNIEKTLRDNMEFLRVSEFTPEQLGDVKEDQVNFNKMWKRVGPQLANLYKEQGDQTGEVAYISNMFSEWEEQVNERIWNRVSYVFRDAGAELQSFNDGDEFTSSFINYVDEASTSATEKEFEQFRDSVWIAEMKANWFPVLVDNEMITVAQKDEMQSAVDNWGNKYDTGTPYYWYILLAFVLIVIVIFIINRSGSRFRSSS